jgi:hypothetical protein
MKEKGRLFADTRLGAKDSDIHSGDKVLVKQDRENKMSTRFNPSPFKVVERNGNSVVVESDQGVWYRRNVTHLKKFHERVNTGLQDSVSLENPDLVLPENESSPESPFNMSKVVLFMIKNLSLILAVHVNLLMISLLASV